jgi:hypothetical protein
MDAAYLEVDDGVTDLSGRGAPIEAKLRLLAIQLLYEVSRSQKMTIQELREHFMQRARFNAHESQVYLMTTLCLICSTLWRRRMSLKTTIRSTMR